MVKPAQNKPSGNKEIKCKITIINKTQENVPETNIKNNNNKSD